MLIGLHGRKQAGKDTVFERASHLMADVVPVERASFADMLYRSAAAALGLTVEDLQAGKTEPSAYIVVHCGDGVRKSSSLTFREYLQRFGTEAHRDIFGSDFWVDNVELDHAGRIVMVTDVRFENEARAVQAAGGRVFRVKGPDEIEHAGDGHASETPLPEHLIDFTLDNSVRDDGYRALDLYVSNLLRQLLRLESGPRPSVIRS